MKKIENSTPIHLAVKELYTEVEKLDEKMSRFRMLIVFVSFVLFFVLGVVLYMLVNMIK